MHSDFPKAKYFSVYEKRLPEDVVNTSKHLGEFYDTDVIVNVCPFFGLNNKLQKKFTVQISRQNNPCFAEETVSSLDRLLV